MSRTTTEHAVQVKTDEEEQERDPGETEQTIRVEADDEAAQEAKADDSDDQR